MKSQKVTVSIKNNDQLKAELRSNQVIYQKIYISKPNFDLAKLYIKNSKKYFTCTEKNN